MAAGRPEDPGARRTPSGRRGSALDRPFARVVAFGIFLLAGAALAWIHRDDLLPSEAAAPADDAIARCVAARWAGIDKMVADGVVDERRAVSFKSRAEALCQAQLGQGG